MGGKLGKKLMTQFVALRTKKYSYLINGGDKKKKVKLQNSVSSDKTLNLKIINIENSTWKQNKPSRTR